MKPLTQDELNELLESYTPAEVREMKAEQLDEHCLRLLAEAEEEDRLFDDFLEKARIEFEENLPPIPETPFTSDFPWPKAPWYRRHQFSNQIFAMAALVLLSFGSLSGYFLDQFFQTDYRSDQMHQREVIIVDETLKQLDLELFELLKQRGQYFVNLANQAQDPKLKLRYYNHAYLEYWRALRLVSDSDIAKQLTEIEEKRKDLEKSN